MNGADFNLMDFDKAICALINESDQIAFLCLEPGVQYFYSVEGDDGLYFLAKALRVIGKTLKDNKDKILAGEMSPFIKVQLIGDREDVESPIAYELALIYLAGSRRTTI